MLAKLKKEATLSNDIFNISFIKNYFYRAISHAYIVISLVIAPWSSEDESPDVLNNVMTNVLDTYSKISKIFVIELKKSGKCQLFEAISKVRVVATVEKFNTHLYFLTALKLLELLDL